MPVLQDPLMIVTDLDGSLLDHHTYSWQPARQWLMRLKEHHIPLVICSSKTAAEIVPLQQELGFGGSPFISENGAVVRYGDAQAEQTAQFSSQDSAAICHTLLRLRQHDGFKFTGFADVSEKEIAEWTGLTPALAARAKMREASESLIWRDSREQFDLFRERLDEAGLTLVQGGRFWHVMSKGSGKGAALRWLLEHYPSPTAQPGQRPLTIGLGDGPNDAPMLDSVDYAVVIHGYSKNPVLLERADKQHIYRSAARGPEGWVEGLDHFITPS
ncbi:mannosyl-3-phosphoglycerate phosphatase-related protein [Erwinia sp. JUb26]|uniref:mannosyl-3-phosphoglycerate phosphatase-related protein n=1 Tax=Erwinia sp. JUb26 TaxID=2485126 RepID=UPI000F478401|nr:mannosyl-3-phosphoglycerate phosphatase-related protein [Erwinia sp. JUb26]ROR11403.1 mannosyl-3-phosphoglycerate phosphatase [Erwinia sp. JUb26]